VCWVSFCLLCSVRLFASVCGLLVIPCCCFFSLMRRGRKRFVAIESKYFDFAIVGIKEDCLQIIEHGRGRRFALILPEQVALWLLKVCTRFCKAKSSNWCNQIRRGSSIFLLESKSNWAGKFLQLSAIKRGRQSSIVFSGGCNNNG